MPYRLICQVGSGRRSYNLHQYLIVNEQEDPQTESSILSMEFVIKRHHVHNGRINIRWPLRNISNLYYTSERRMRRNTSPSFCRCEASILSVYKKDKEVHIFVETHTAANLSNNKDGSESDATVIVASHWPVGGFLLLALAVAMRQTEA